MSLFSMPRLVFDALPTTNAAVQRDTLSNLDRLLDELHITRFEEPTEICDVNPALLITVLEKITGKHLFSRRNDWRIFQGEGEALVCMVIAIRTLKALTDEELSDVKPSMIFVPDYEAPMYRAVGYLLHAAEKGGYLRPERFQSTPKWKQPSSSRVQSPPLYHGLPTSAALAGSTQMVDRPQRPHYSATAAVSPDPAIPASLFLAGLTPKDLAKKLSAVGLADTRPGPRPRPLLSSIDWSRPGWNDTRASAFCGTTTHNIDRVVLSDRSSTDMAVTAASYVDVHHRSSEFKTARGFEVGFEVRDSHFHNASFTSMAVTATSKAPRTKRSSIVSGRHQSSPAHPNPASTACQEPASITRVVDPSACRPNYYPTPTLHGSTSLVTSTPKVVVDRLSRARTRPAHRKSQSMSVTGRTTLVEGISHVSSGHAYLNQQSPGRTLVNPAPSGRRSTHRSRVISPKWSIKADVDEASPGPKVSKFYDDDASSNVGDNVPSWEWTGSVIGVDRASRNFQAVLGIDRHELQYASLSLSDVGYGLERPSATPTRRQSHHVTSEYSDRRARAY